MASSLRQAKWKAMQGTLLFCLQKESSPRPGPNSYTQQGTGLCSDSTTGVMGTAPKTESNTVTFLGSRQGESENNRKCIVSDTREKSFINSFVVPDDFVYASHQCDSILWEAQSMALKYIVRHTEFQLSREQALLNKRCL